MMLGDPNTVTIRLSFWATQGRGCETQVTVYTCIDSFLMTAVWGCHSVNFGPVDLHANIQALHPWTTSIVYQKATHLLDIWFDLVHEQ
jgi:hypothetical protein